MILSIVVPVYNVQNYLKKCIDSLFDQDLDTSNYEVIAINDGSTDHSLVLLESLKKNYTSLKIITQDNKGLSGARNAGIEKAKGDYILFVDSDDYILKNTLAKITKIAKKNNLDILEFGAKIVTETNQTVYVSKNSSYDKVITGEKYMSHINYMSSACTKLYKRQFLYTHDLRFMERVYIEDIEFNTRAIFKSTRIQAIDTIIAHFLQREGSITRTKDLVKTKKMIYDIHTVLSSIDNFNNDIITPKSAAYLPIKRRTCGLVTTMLIRVLTNINDYNIKKDVFSKLKEQELYPIPFKPGEKKKDQFRWFANQDMLFSIVCKLYCLKNKYDYN